MLSQYWEHSGFGAGNNSAKMSRVTCCHASLYLMDYRRWWVSFRQKKIAWTTKLVLSSLEMTEMSVHRVTVYFEALLRNAIMALARFC